MNCKKCGHGCIKNGFQTNGTQRYFCKSCKISQQKIYSYNAYKKDTNTSIISLIINSCGIIDISRVLSISKTTVLKRMLSFASQISKPKITEYNQVYEIDEMHVKFPGTTKYYLMYAINRKTKQIIDFFIGRRTKENLNGVVKRVLSLNPKKIYTDKLNIYATLIPSTIKCSRNRQTNTIERYHLNIRTHLKRLSRKSICYSKKINYLIACVTIYFWSRTDHKDGSLQYIYS